jgi:hypothetical protein
MAPASGSRTICVHIGTHKTGTTSIQAFLAGNRERLRAHGLYVPKAGTIHARSGHHNLAWQLRGDPRFDPACGTLDDLLAELGDVAEPNAVISSEDFEYCAERPQALAELERALRAAGWEPRYLVLFRRQRDYAVSLHAELIRHGFTASFARFVAEILRRGRFVMKGDWCFYFDYAAFLDQWRRGATGALQARRFARAGAGGSLIEEFLAAVGVPAPALAGCIARAEVLNPGQGKAEGPARWLSGMLLDGRFALANARLRRRFGVDLR